MALITPRTVGEMLWLLDLSRTADQSVVDATTTTSIRRPGPRFETPIAARLGSSSQKYSVQVLFISGFADRSVTKIVADKSFFPTAPARHD